MPVGHLPIMRANTHKTGKRRQGGARARAATFVAALQNNETSQKLADCDKQTFGACPQASPIPAKHGDGNS
jgi:hypothetical protein